MKQSLLARLAALESRQAPPEHDPGPSILARLALIRERLDEARARGDLKIEPGPPSGSRLSDLIEAARMAQARASS
jgi:hypothetical protein